MRGETYMRPWFFTRLTKINFFQINIDKNLYNTIQQDLLYPTQRLPLFERIVYYSALKLCNKLRTHFK